MRDLSKSSVTRKISSGFQAIIVVPTRVNNMNRALQIRENLEHPDMKKQSIMYESELTFVAVQVGAFR